MTPSLRLRVLLALSVLLLATVSLPAAAAADSPPQTEASLVIQMAEDQLGSRYAFATAGPNTFDCSGFVTFAYRRAGLLDRIGARRRTVAGFHKWFKRHDAVSADLDSAQPGDLIIWGRDKHIGIYVGDGMAISALLNPRGITLHKVNWLNDKFSYVLQVNLER